MCYKQKCKVVSLNLAHPVYTLCSENTHLQFLSYLLFLRYIHCNFCLNLAINHVDYESVSWCFFLNTVYLASGWFAPSSAPGPRWRSSYFLSKQA